MIFVLSAVQRRPFRPRPGNSPPATQRDGVSGHGRKNLKDDFIKAGCLSDSRDSLALPSRNRALRAVETGERCRRIESLAGLPTEGGVASAGPLLLWQRRWVAGQLRSRFAPGLGTGCDVCMGVSVLFGKESTLVVSVHTTRSWRGWRMR